MEKNKKKESLQEEVKDAYQQLDCDAPWSNIDTDEDAPTSCPS